MDGMSRLHVIFSSKTCCLFWQRNKSALVDVFNNRKVINEKTQIVGLLFVAFSQKVSGEFHKKNWMKAYQIPASPPQI